MTSGRSGRWWTPSTTITDEGRRTRSNLQTFVITLIVIAVLGWALAEFGQDRTGSGPDGSVFVTDVNGVAALGDLLGELGHPVVPAIAPFSSMDEGGSVFIIDPGLRTEYAPEEIDALDRWLGAGGVLIYAGRTHQDLVGPILPDGLGQGFSGQTDVEIVTPIRGVDGTLTARGITSVDSPVDGLALAGDPPVAMAFEHDRGVVVYIADSSILRNQALATNAPWVVSLVPDGTVRFDEVRHGFTAGSADANATSLLAALPDDVRHVVLLLLPVLVLGLVVYGRRFGPPEATERTLAPPRRELVDAVAGLMTRMPDPVEAAHAIPERLRFEVEHRAGLEHGADDDALLAAAAGIGVEPTRLEAALHPRDEESLMRAQRLLAELSERKHT